MRTLLCLKARDHPGQVRVVLKRLSDLFLGLELRRIQQSCMRSADRHSTVDFWCWTIRAEVRPGEITGKPHGKNLGDKLANTQAT